MIASPRRPLVAGLACLLALAGRPIAAADDPRARRCLEEVVGAYKALPAYADHGRFNLAMTVRGKLQEQSTEGAVTFARPNKIAMEAGGVRLTSDGEKISTVVQSLKRYTVITAPRTLRLESFIDNPLGAMLFSGPGGLPKSILLTLLLADDPMETLLVQADGLSAEADREVEGLACNSIVVDMKRGPDVRLLIDPAQKLLRRIELVIDPEDLARLPSEANVSEISAAWTSGAIATEVPDGAFAFTPPPDLQKVRDLASRREVRPEQRSPLEGLVGQAAPDFTLTVLDGLDKTRQLGKADLAGKVVLLDFWATWCGPCLKELPEIQKLVEGYAKKGTDNLVVVALSQDNGPGEVEEVRKLVEKTLAEQELRLERPPASLVAIDPLNAIGKAFHVEGYPTIVLLDGKGIVQSVHVGFRPDVRETLIDDIDTLLAGRSLAEPKEAAAKPQE